MNDKTYIEWDILSYLIDHREKIFLATESGLEEKHFEDYTAKKLYGLMLELAEENNFKRISFFSKAQNIISGADELIAKLNQRSGAIDSDEEFNAAIKIMRERHQRQELLKLSAKIEMLAQEETKDIPAIQSEIQEKLAKITETPVTSKMYNTEEGLLLSYEAYVQRKHSDESVKLVPSGFHTLDRLIGGFKKGHLIVLAGSTSMGKTAFALNIAKNVAKSSESVGIISLEMDAQEIFDRMIVAQGRVNGMKFNSGKTSQLEDQRVSKALDELNELKMIVADQRGLTSTQICAKARQMKRTNDIGLLVVDYLQMINLGDGFDSSSKKVGQVVLNLRNLAGELQIPVILLSQINRKFTSRNSKRPILSDLRDSGNIEEVSDSVIFIHREAHTSIEAREKARSEGTENHAEIIVAKARTGQTGSIKLMFEGETTLFIDLNRY